MTDAKESDISSANVEMVESIAGHNISPPNEDISPPNEMKRELDGELEEKTTAKAWLSIFVSSQPNRHP